jgi:hypothetical protein
MALKRILDDPIWALEETGRFTDMELFRLFTNVNTVIKMRLHRRFWVEANAVCDAIKSYFSHNPLTVKSAIKIRNIECKRMDASHISVTIRFKFGEKYKGVRYTDQDPSKERTFYAYYYLKISCSYAMGICYEVKLTPPIHHVISLPTNRDGNSDEECTANAALRFDNKEAALSPDSEKQKTLKRAGGPSSYDRKNIYGDLLKPFTQYFIHERRAVEIINLAENVYHKYHQYPIGKARAATMTFLLIGRFRSIGEIRLPYDVVKIIANRVWKSRHNVDKWRITEKEVPRDIYYHRGRHFEDDNACDTSEDHLPPYIRDYEIPYDPKLVKVPNPEDDLCVCCPNGYHQIPTGGP